MPKISPQIRPGPAIVPSLPKPPYDGGTDGKSLFGGSDAELDATQFALEHASDGVFWAEPNGCFAYVNEAACRSLGYSREELLAMQVFDLAPQAQIEEWRGRWRQLKARRVIIYEISHRTRTGRIIPVEITVNHVAHLGREYAFGFLRDISALRAAQQALRARERRYREFLAHTSEGVWCLEFQEPVPADLSADEQLNIIYRTGYVSECNDAFARIRGFQNSSEVTGMRLRDLASPMDWRAVKQAVRRVGLAGSAEYRRREPDGTLRYFLRNHIAIVDAGFIQQVWGTTLEITERRRTEEALRESDRRFRKMLETVELVAVMLDPEGRVTFCNDHTTRVTGWSRQEILDKNWFDLCAPEKERPRRKLEFHAMISAADLPAHYEQPILARDGRSRLIAWDNTLLRDPDGRAAGIACLGRDITDHRALEEQYRQAQKLESIGRLAGGVAHDFNNLLTIINAYSEFLLETIAESDPARVNLVEIRKASDKAAALTQQLLAFGRRQVLQLQVLDLNAVVSEADRMLRRVIGEDIELATNLDPLLGCIRADAGQLTQVLLNLAVNARDAMPRGGKLTIATSNVEGGSGQSLPPGAYVQVSVSDTGSGINPEDLPHIYEPFFTTKHPGKGTGLGLSTVYGIVQQSGGQILVESELGRGTTFRVCFPCVGAEAAAPRPSAPPPRSATAGTETILVVEDQEEVRNAAVGILKNQGYTVCSAVNGRDALAQVSEGVRMVLTDVVMPEMSGRELAESLRNIRPDIRILFMSGYAYEAQAGSELVQPGEGFIQKPFTPTDLAAKVRELLDAPLRPGGSSPQPESPAAI